MPRAVMLFAGLVIVGAACTDSQDALLLAPTLPADTDLVGLIVEQGNEIRLATGLQPFDASTTLSLDVTEGDFVHLVGFSRSQLGGAIDLPTEDVLASSPLSWAAERSPRLPSPSFHGTARFPGDSVEASVAPAELTAGWLPDCPVLFPVEGRSLLAHCGAGVCGGAVSQSECRVEISGVCLLSSEDWFVDGIGRIVPGDDGALEDCLETNADSFEERAYACPVPEGELDDCRFALPRPEEALAFEVDSVDVYRPQESGETVSAPILLGSEVAVIRYPGAAVATQEAENCMAPQRTELVFLDPETMSELRTVELPDCLYRPRPDPIGGGFLALSNKFGVAKEALFRVAPDGTVTASVSLPRFESANPMRLAVSGSHVLIVYNQAQLAVSGSPTILLDTETFELLDMVSFNGIDSSRREVTAAFNIDRRRFGLLDKEVDGVVFLDTGDHTIRESSVFPISTSKAPGCPTSNLKLRDGAYDVANDIVLVANGAASPTVIAVFDRQTPGCTESASHEPAGADPLSFAPWTAHPNHVVVTFFTEDERSTFTVFDIAQGFIRPGAVDLGQGRARPPATDETGRVWVSMLGSGELFRITPAGR